MHAILFDKYPFQSSYQVELSFDPYDSASIFLFLEWP